MPDNYSILIIDDSFADRFLLKRILGMTKMELTIAEAEDGHSALEFLTRPLDQLKLKYPTINAPIILFLDINMPVMNGWEFLQELEKRDDEVQLKPSIVVMYTTADASYERKRAGSYRHVVHYMTKDEPTPDNLKKVILTCHPS